MLKCQTPMLNDEVCRAMTDKQTHKQKKKTYIQSKNRGNLFFPAKFSFFIFVSLIHLKVRKAVSNILFQWVCISTLLRAVSAAAWYCAFLLYVDSVVGNVNSKTEKHYASMEWKNKGASVLMLWLYEYMIYVCMFLSCAFFINNCF